VKFTVLGATGFIGSNMITYLEEKYITVNAPGRKDPAIFNSDLGHVIYSIGLTADFRQKPFETVDAHVSYLQEVLYKGNYNSFVYLSSTRVYAGSKDGNEDSPLLVNSTDPSDLYNLSKLMGEAICFATKNPNVRVARLSNVFGNNYDSPDFLFTILRDAVKDQKIVLRSSIRSSKDYINVRDVVELLFRIALHGKHTLYNVASGINTSNSDIVYTIQRLTNCILETSESREGLYYPLIQIDRIREEFGYSPSTLTDCLQEMISKYMNERGN
jgi:nucleoside-diphosphate-sugar epimerase